MTIRGLKPTNENRPDTSFFSVDSKRKLYAWWLNFLNVETGVSQSPTNSAKTGMTLPCFARCRNSCSDGVISGFIQCERKLPEFSCHRGLEPIRDEIALHALGIRDGAAP